MEYHLYMFLEITHTQSQTMYLTHAQKKFYDIFLQ